MLSAAFAVLTAFSPLPVAPELPALVNPGPILSIQFADGVVISHLSGPEHFVGFVLVSLSPELTYSYVDLPPLLGDAMLLGMAKGSDGMMKLAVKAEFVPPTPLTVYAQGVIADGSMILSSAVESFELGPYR